MTTSATRAATWSPQATGSPACTSLSVSIIVPTYCEAANLPRLVERLVAMRESSGLDLDVIVVDDDSQDGTEELFNELAHPWIRLVIRREDRGLSQSVLEGLSQASGDYVVVMDADLSHPPEAIPGMLARLEAGDEFVIGSRYVPGGSTDAAWGVYRYLNSKVATWLARPFTRAKDPMAGFFAFRRSALASAAPLNPIGYKIGLELIVKCGLRRIGEVPIHFADRTAGHSKLNFKEQLRYLQHVRRLFVWKHPNWSYVLQFAVVGGSGLIVNLVILTLLLLMRMPEPIAIAGGIAVSIVSNFILNRRFTFSYAKDGPLLQQFLSFLGACSVGATVNYATALFVLSLTPDLPVQVAAIAGVAAGMVINFAMNRYLTFRKTRATP